MALNKDLVIAAVAKGIYEIRGYRVMLDSDLAVLYGESIGRLNEQVTRNLARFPEDFMFRLTRQEAQALGSQNAILKRGQHRKTPPRAFTQEGVAMLSGVLRSKRAIQANISIMRAFVQIRRLALSHSQLNRRLAEVEKHVAALGRRQGDQGEGMKVLLGAVRKLLTAPSNLKKPIGFRPKKR